MKCINRPPLHIPELRTATLLPKDYQPGMAKMEEKLSERQLFTFVPKSTWLRLGSCRPARVARSIAAADARRNPAGGHPMDGDSSLALQSGGGSGQESSMTSRIILKLEGERFPSDRLATSV